MNAKQVGLALGAVFVVSMGCVGAATAQTAEPTYKGDPNVYKVIFEDANFRVIEANRKKGVHDKAHGHPVVAILYNVTDCKSKQYFANGKTLISDSKADTANAVPIIASHSTENIGDVDCKQIFIEKK